MKVVDRAVPGAKAAHAGMPDPATEVTSAADEALAAEAAGEGMPRGGAVPPPMPGMAAGGGATGRERNAKAEPAVAAGAERNAKAEPEVDEAGAGGGAGAGAARNEKAEPAVDGGGGGGGPGPGVVA